ncbi:MAG: MurR/RpiR family transcriptional regulator [Longibaculum sp.]
MIIEKLIEENNLTESEKQIGKYILNKNNDLSLLTSVELGKRSYTSQSTVIRLYKKLGFKTYREFISNLILERNEYFKVDDIVLQQPSQCFSSYEEIQSIISKMYAMALIKTNILLDKNTIIRICNRISSAKSIDVYAVGISTVIGKQLAFKLQSLGLACVFHDGLNLNYIKKQDPRNISIIIGLSGENPMIYSIVKTLSQHKNCMISLMGRKVEKIMELCLDNLVFYTQENNDVDVLVDLFSGEYVINLIYIILKSKLDN